MNAEYLQDWLIDEIGAGNKTTTKLSVWRTNPAQSGITNCVGDIGTHIEDTVAYMCGLHPVKVAAVLDYYGMNLELNANILVEYETGAHGIYSCSQVCVGHNNGNEIKSGEKIQELKLHFPTVPDGVQGVRFIHAVVKSHENNSIWIHV